MSVKVGVSGEAVSENMNIRRVRYMGSTGLGCGPPGKVDTGGSAAELGMSLED